ncbi:MAG: FAD binding domain-containing protein [Beijerinckiaceae bacterium]
MGLLHRPRSTAEALAQMAAGPATLIAGGTDIFPALVDRPTPARLIDLSDIAELRGIEIGAKAIRIGAATTWSEIVGAELPPSCRMLQQAAREVGSIQIQNRGTIGGNLCNASPAADGVPPLIALDAEVELVSPGGTRRMPVEAFLVGNRRTQRNPDEILRGIIVPGIADEASSAFVKLGARKYLVISIVMVAALIALDADRRISAARVAVGSASEKARRLRDLEERLVGRSVDDPTTLRISADDMANLSPIDDVRATAAYRRRAAATLVSRAIVDAAGQGDA